MRVLKMIDNKYENDYDDDDKIVEPSVVWNIRNEIYKRTRVR